ncbi:hypothetical protein I7I48_01512 [Histoplasma ohiense]|nr:hypothetical protein I7I48_01512 [Histoplasma ohiense (nom. inval.)]
MLFFFFLSFLFASSFPHWVSVLSVQWCMRWHVPFKLSSLFFTYIYLTTSYGGRNFTKVRSRPSKLP